MICIAGMGKNTYLAASHMNATHTKAEQSSTEPCYVARSYDGYIAIFLPNNSEPYEKTTISLNSLREEDQKKIIAGINLYNDKELTSFLEDYGS